MPQEVKPLKQTNTMEAMSKVFRPSSYYGARKLWRGSCRLSKCDSQKPEFTRRTIFNRSSTLQFIVQISSGSVNSSVRARAKSHGCTPASIELPRGRHLGSNACIFWARTLASSLHKSAQKRAPDAYISLCKSTTQDTCAPRGYTRLYMHALRDACISLARVQEMRAP